MDFLRWIWKVSHPSLCWDSSQISDTNAKNKVLKVLKVLAQQQLISDQISQVPILAQSRHAFSLLSILIKQKGITLGWSEVVQADTTFICVSLHENFKGRTSRIYTTCPKNFKSRYESNKQTNTFNENMQNTSLNIPTWPKGQSMSSPSCDSQRSSFKVLLIDLTFSKRRQILIPSGMTHGLLLFRWDCSWIENHGLWATGYSSVFFYLRPCYSLFPSYFEMTCTLFLWPFNLFGQPPMLNYRKWVANT